MNIIKYPYPREKMIAPLIIEQPKTIDEMITDAKKLVAAHGMPVSFEYRGATIMVSKGQASQNE